MRVITIHGQKTEHVITPVGQIQHVRTLLRVIIILNDRVSMKAVKHLPIVLPVLSWMTLFNSPIVMEVLIFLTA